MCKNGPTIRERRPRWMESMEDVQKNVAMRSINGRKLKETERILKY